MPCSDVVDGHLSTLESPTRSSGSHDGLSKSVNQAAKVRARGTISTKQHRIGLKLATLDGTRTATRLDGRSHPSNLPNTFDADSLMINDTMSGFGFESDSHQALGFFGDPLTKALESRKRRDELDAPSIHHNGPSTKTAAMHDRKSRKMLKACSTPRPVYDDSPTELQTPLTEFTPIMRGPFEDRRMTPAVPLATLAKQLRSSSSNPSSGSSLQERTTYTQNLRWNRTSSTMPISRPRNVSNDQLDSRERVPDVDRSKDPIRALDYLMQEVVQVAKDAVTDGRTDILPGILNEAQRALQNASEVHDRQAVGLAFASHIDRPLNSQHSSTWSSDSSVSTLTPTLLEGQPNTSRFVGQRANGSNPDAFFTNTAPTAIEWTTSSRRRRNTNWNSPDKSFPLRRVTMRLNPDGPSSPVTSEGSRPRGLPSDEDVHSHIWQHDEPPIPVRQSSLRLRNIPGSFVEDVSRPNQIEISPTGVLHNMPNKVFSPLIPGAGHNPVINPPLPSARVVTPTQGPSPAPDMIVLPRARATERVMPTSDDLSPDEVGAADDPASSPIRKQPQKHNWGSDKYDEKDYVSTDALKGKNHIILGDNQQWSIHHHRRQPIARNWSTPRKRFTAGIACINTALVGVIIGIYAGEVPAIQYALTDMNHRVILGNVVLYLSMAVTTFLFWPLPLLHGRKPYTLLALAIVLPLQFPQAIMVSTRRLPTQTQYKTGLLTSRAISGLALGFAHINFMTTLLDLFGASLQSTHPHGELVIIDDVRRHGGGMGLWLGLWTFSFIGSLSIGFFIGAEVVSGLNVSWGFYITVILIALTLLMDVIAPEPRRSPHRRSMQEVELPNMNIERRVAKGEIKLHVTGEGPKYWYEEVWAGIFLSIKMLDQPGFGLMALYLGWVYGEIILIIVAS